MIDSRFKLNEADLKAAFDAGVQYAKDPARSASFKHWLAVQECYAGFELSKEALTKEVSESDIF